MKKTGKIILIILSSFVGILLFSFIFILIKSPGKLEPLKNELGIIIENSISEKSKTEIGGIQQAYFIRGENQDNPVILYLHGGPGSPELPMTIKYESSERLEKYFTVCYWEQRGAGMTYSKSLDPSTATVEQMVEDTHEMTKFLQKKFNKDKIYIMGHSWGSYLGIKTIQKYPENYFVYIGIGQVTNQLESEILAYDYMLQHAKDINDLDVIQKLEQFDKNAPDFPSSDYLLTARTSYMNKYGIGIMHKNFSISDLIKDIIFFKAYTLSDKINYMRGSMFSLKYIFPYVTKDNLFESSNSFDIPVYITHGKYDYQVSYELANKYFQHINAPEKGFYTFENSAHSPNIEEPEKFVKLIKGISEKHSN